MAEKVHLIVRTLKKVQRIEFSRLVTPWRDRMHGVMTLLAGLELGRRRIISLRQTKPFSELWVYKNEALDDDALPLDMADEEFGTQQELAS